MAIGAAGVGFMAVDLVPKKHEIRDKVPGVKIDIDDYKKVGTVFGLVLDKEGWDSYDTDFVQRTLAGVIYAGAITGYFGVVSRGPFGPGLTKGGGVAKGIIERFIKQFGYEKDPKDDVKPVHASDDPIFRVSASMVRTRPLPPIVLRLDEMYRALPGFIKWGKQFAEETIRSLPHAFGRCIVPLGMMCVSAGFRFWAVGGAGRYSVKKKRIADHEPNIKEGFKKVLDDVDEYRCWEQVFWHGGFISP